MTYLGTGSGAEGSGDSGPGSASIFSAHVPSIDFPTIAIPERDLPPLRRLHRAARSVAFGRRTHRRSSEAIMMALDTVAASTAVATGMLVAAATGIARPPAWEAAIVVAVLLVSLLFHGMYRGNGLRLIPSGLPTFTTVSRSLPLAMLATIAILAALGRAGGTVGLLALAALLLAPAVVTVPALRSAAAHLGSKFGVGRHQRVLVLGAGEAADHVMKRLERHGLITPLGMVDDDPLPGFETIGALADLPRLCEDLRADRIIVALPRAPWLKVSETIQPLIGHLDVAIVPSLYELMTWRSGTAELAGLPLVPLVPAQRSLLATAGKRAFDLAFGLLALLLAAPVVAAAAVAIKLDSPGPVFFRQARSGRGGNTFSILKFRTMHVGAERRREELMAFTEADGGRFKMQHDPRVTRVGGFLRRFSIDELPQLFNVLSGKMSLVGPRPFPLVESEAFYTGPAIARFDMDPGMTGLWQVSGRSDLSWDDLCRLDSIYVGSWSLLWDLRILLQTPVAVLRRRGAY